MFTSSSLETEMIDGQRFTTFQPNTIVYAVPRYSDLDRQIRSAKIGVVSHTTYQGKLWKKCRRLLVQTLVDSGRTSRFGWMMLHTVMRAELRHLLNRKLML